MLVYPPMIDIYILVICQTLLSKGTYSEGQSVETYVKMLPHSPTLSSTSAPNTGEGVKRNVNGREVVRQDRRRNSRYSVSSSVLQEMSHGVLITSLLHACNTFNQDKYKISLELRFGKVKLDNLHACGFV